MNSDREMIPIVEDDQGEGYKDPWEEGMLDADDENEIYQERQRHRQIMKQLSRQHSAKARGR